MADPDTDTSTPMALAANIAFTRLMRRRSPASASMAGKRCAQVPSTSRTATAASKSCRTTARRPQLEGPTGRDRRGRTRIAADLSAGPPTDTLMPRGGATAVCACNDAIASASCT